MAEIEQDTRFTIERTVNAPRDLVWQTFTDAEHLKHWWGPKGFTMQVAKVDMRPGGLFHYGMQSPGGQTMWGKFTYLEIVPPEFLSFTVSFSDENGGVTRHPMSETWPLEMLTEITFSEVGSKTKITMRGEAYNASEIERATYHAGHDSMRQGFGGTFDQLDAYLAQLQREAVQ